MNTTLPPPPVAKVPRPLTADETARLLAAKLATLATPTPKRVRQAKAAKATSDWA